jgi:26S proteasome regulatory subunit N7
MVSKEEKKAEDEAQTMDVEEEQEQSPLLRIAQMKFLLTLGGEECPATEKATLKQTVLALIAEKNMVGYYKSFCAELKWGVDEVLLAQMTTKQTEELKKLEEKIKDAETNLGESEVREGYLAKADYLALSGGVEETVAAFDATEEKTVGAGQKIDLVFALIRVGLSWGDHELVKKNITKAEELVEKGGDWERRNRLGVYRATYLLTIRQFKEAAELFLKAVATFNCYEMYSYEDFIFHTVVTSLIALDRVTLRKKVVKAPEILSVIHEIPNLEPFLTSLYKCKYGDFIRALSNITPQIKRDMYTSAHTGYLMREIRVVAYSQFLEAYKSVTLASMANSFGVSEDFIDRELSRFIAAGRLTAKIDKVGGIVETNRLDTKNLQYVKTIKEGDLLLNRIQKLTKVISY